MSGENQSAEQDSATKPDATADKNTSGTAPDTGQPADGADQGTSDAEFTRRLMLQKAAEARESKREANTLRAEKAALEQVVTQLKSAPQGDPNAKPASPQPPAQQLTQDQIRAEAARLVAEQDFTRRSNEVWNKGLESYPDFQATVADTFKLVELPVDAIETIVDLREPHKVLYELAKNRQEAHRILSLPPKQRDIELVRYEAKLAAAPADKKPNVSQAPAPIRSVESKRSTSGTVDVLDPKTNTDDWFAARRAQKAAQAASRRR